MHINGAVIDQPELSAMSRLVDLVCCTLLCFVYSVILWCPSEAARILAVVPTPSISHHLVFRPLTEELARRGHQVVVITTDPAFPKGQTPENLTEIDVHDVSYDAWRKLIVTNSKGDKDSSVRQITNIMDVVLKIFEKQTAVAEVRDIIENQNDEFDLLLLEAWARFALGFTHVIKKPVIAVSSLGGIFDNYDVIGAPSHPFLYPHPMNTRIYNLTRWEKIKQFYDTYSLLDAFRKIEEKENVVVRKVFGENIPPLSELQNNIDMLFVNTYTLWEGNRPVPPGVIHIGGIHQTPQKELPQDLKEYLDSSVHGVIFLSFGTNVETSLIPRDKIQAMINVFSQLPYDVLWKWNQDELPGRTENIKISKWLPQSDLLRHPKVKLFITQGGLQSTHETLTAGVPVIGIPMFSDQWYNTEKYVHFKIGKKIDIDDLKEETFKSAIKTVIEDKSYRDNMVRLRMLLHDQPQSPLERAVWWTEHVLRHGGARHLRAPAANMRADEYYELELVVVVLSVAITVTALAALVLYKIVVLLLRHKTSSVKDKSL